MKSHYRREAYLAVGAPAEAGARPQRLPRVSGGAACAARHACPAARYLPHPAGRLHGVVKHEIAGCMTLAEDLQKAGGVGTCRLMPPPPPPPNPQLPGLPYTLILCGVCHAYTYTLELGRDMLPLHASRSTNYASKQHSAA